MDFSLLHVDMFHTYIIGKEVELAKSHPLSGCSDVATTADGTLMWTLIALLRGKNLARSLCYLSVGSIK